MKRIIIDAGHGYNTPGKRIPNAGYVLQQYRGAREWALNDRVAKYVEDILNKLKTYDIAIARSDDRTGVKDVSLAQRKINSAGADIFISIHHNAGLNGKKGGGVTVYSRKQTKGETRLFKMGQEARKLYDAVVAHNGNKGNRANPVSQANFSVLAGNPASIALLIECGFMDGPDDIPLITDNNYAYHTAQGIASYIISALDLQPTQRRTHVVKAGDTLWKIANEYLGDGNRYKEIAEINALSMDSKRQFLIYPGQTLALPD